MANSSPKLVKLSDYRPSAFLIDKVDLAFDLHPDKTRVRSEIHFRSNPEYTDGPHDLHLDGCELTLISAQINGHPLPDGALQINDTGLTVPHHFVPTDPFIWQADVEINPKANTALDGLYMSNGMYCTQCEAQGFRKITYFLDRPDVMAPYSVTINGDGAVKLSNGNPTGDGKWHDPWPKPSYLFALVAGDLVSVEDQFTTKSGRDVTLKIWVRHGDVDKCAYAIDALKRSMRWDEQVYCREYDLDIFQIVAVSDFNMGAMENKGLNIFNSKYVLVSPQTATDRDYALVEAIIAHEYFHNWTGNRITCRDWFQLSLKEGLTVFRDQQFSADMRSAAVKRIQDVQMLKTRQFREDAGPLAHPVRPAAYQAINNFYTATVYEKGAELINMIKNYVGDDHYAQALDLYFDRHDGQACTIEDWLQVFADVTGQNFDQFKLWYEQSGTPDLRITERYENGQYHLTLSQDQPPAPNRKGKAAQVIPVRCGFLGADGEQIMPEQVLTLTQTQQEFDLGPCAQKPILSPLRALSAPVNLIFQRPVVDYGFLLRHDSDGVNRWDAGRKLALNNLHHMLCDQRADLALHIDALGSIVDDETIEPAFRALLLQLPSDDDIAADCVARDITPQPDQIYKWRQSYIKAIADSLNQKFLACFDKTKTPGPYLPDAHSAGRRALQNMLQWYITRVDGGALARAQFTNADNMTQRQNALIALLSSGTGTTEAMQYYNDWQHDPLVIDGWFNMQVSTASPDRALGVAQKLCAHPDFKMTNPNRLRAVVGAFAQNHAAIHHKDGSGYAFLADWLIKLDPVNPQTTARLAGLFETWRRYDDAHQNHAKMQMQRVLETHNLSADTFEILSKLLKAL